MSDHSYSLCESPHCPLCRTDTPILCDEIKVDDKFIIKTTKRERDLAKIIIFFYDKCKDDIMDKIKLDQFPKHSIHWDLANTAYAYHTYDSKEWSFQIHSMSYTKKDFELPYNLIKVAIHHGILDSYKQFLHANNLQGFIPTDLETVD